jgi:hypothetical protein
VLSNGPDGATQRLVDKLSEFFGTERVSREAADFYEIKGNIPTAEFLGIPGTAPILGAKKSKLGLSARKLLQQELGRYAQRNIWEFIAEAERHYLTERYPGPLAKIVGEWFDKELGISPESVFHDSFITTEF